MVGNLAIEPKSNEHATRVLNVGSVSAVEQVNFQNFGHCLKMAILGADGSGSTCNSGVKVKFKRPREEREDSDA
jgi:hypothetical protein